MPIRAAHYSHNYPFKVTLAPTENHDVYLDAVVKSVKLTPHTGRDRVMMPFKKNIYDFGNAEPNSKRGGQFMRRRKGMGSIKKLHHLAHFSPLPGFGPEQKRQPNETIKSLSGKRYHLEIAA